MNLSTTFDFDEIWMDVYMGRPDMGPTWDPLVPALIFIMISIFPFIIHVTLIFL